MVNDTIMIVSVCLDGCVISIVVRLINTINNQDFTEAAIATLTSKFMHCFFPAITISLLL